MDAHSAPVEEPCEYQRLGTRRRISFRLNDQIELSGDRIFFTTESTLERAIDPEQTEEKFFKSLRDEARADLWQAHGEFAKEILDRKSRRRS